MRVFPKSSAQADFCIIVKLYVGRWMSETRDEPRIWNYFNVSPQKSIDVCKPRGIKNMLVAKSDR